MIHASDLIGCVVRTRDGERLGRVHDLRARRAGDRWELVGLIVGRDGMRSRLVGGEGPAVYEGEVVPWASITQLEEGSIVIDPP